MLKRGRLVSERLLTRLLIISASVKGLIGRRLSYFSDDNVITINLVGRANNAIVIQLLVSRHLQASCLRGVRLANLFVLALVSGVSPVEDRSKEASVDS